VLKRRSLTTKTIKDTKIVLRLMRFPEKQEITGDCYKGYEIYRATQGHRRTALA